MVVFCPDRRHPPAGLHQPGHGHQPGPRRHLHDVLRHLRDGGHHLRRHRRVLPPLSAAWPYVPMYMYYLKCCRTTPFLFFLLSMFIGLVFGILNGVLVSYLRLPPLIATLATSSIASGRAGWPWAPVSSPTLPPPCSPCMRST